METKPTNNSLSHIVRNGSMVCESIIKNRNISKLEKINLLIHRLNSMRADLIQLKKQEEG